MNNEKKTICDIMENLNVNGENNENQKKDDNKLGNKSATTQFSLEIDMKKISK